MDETLHQLGGLLLGSVPTIFLFLLLVILYRFLVYGPLTRVLSERRARTEGAIEQANAADWPPPPQRLRNMRRNCGLRDPGSSRRGKKSCNSGIVNETTRWRKLSRLPSARWNKQNQPCRCKPPPPAAPSRTLPTSWQARFSAPFFPRAAQLWRKFVELLPLVASYCSSAVLCGRRGCALARALQACAGRTGRHSCWPAAGYWTRKQESGDDVYRHSASVKLHGALVACGQRDRGANCSNS